MSGVTSEELTNLFPGEREALEDDAEDPGAPVDEAEDDAGDDAEDDAGEDEGEDAGEDGDEQADGDAEEDEDVGGDDGEQSDKDGAEDGAEDDKDQSGDQSVEDAADDDVLPVSQAEVMKMAREDEEYKAAIAKLGKEFDDGSVQMSTIELMEAKDKLFNEAVQRAEERAIWGAQCKRFFAAHPELVGEENADLFAAFNQQVISLAAGEGKGKSGTWILNKAHENFTTRLSKAMGVTQPAPKKAEPKKEGKKLPRLQRPDPKAVPPTLTGVPEADAMETDQNRFAYLDRLTGLKLEAALARLTPAEREEYENS